MRNFQNVSNTSIVFYLSILIFVSGPHMFQLIDLLGNIYNVMINCIQRYIRCMYRLNEGQTADIFVWEKDLVLIFRFADQRSKVKVTEGAKRSQ